MRGFLVLWIAACGSGSSHTDATGTGDGVNGNANYMFVTQAAMPGTDITSLAHADAICNTAGAALGGTYVAWLSSSAVAADARLGSATGWVRPDGKPFADTPFTIAEGHIIWPPLIDETGHDVGAALVATGSDLFGNVAQACNDYAGPSTALLSVGEADGGTLAWTELAKPTCDTTVHLYCFGIDRMGHVAPSPAAGRHAFVTNGLFLPGGGLGAADALCASEASAAALSGTYLAMLATTTASAASRFAAGAPWSRLDGVEVTTDLVTIEAPLDVASDATYADAFAFTGAMDFTTQGTMTCSDWTISTLGHETYGGNSDIASQVAYSGSGSDLAACDLAEPIYCFEQ